MREIGNTRIQLTHFNDYKKKNSLTFMGFQNGQTEIDALRDTTYREK